MAASSPQAKSSYNNGALQSQTDGSKNPTGDPDRRKVDCPYGFRRGGMNSDFGLVVGVADPCEGPAEDLISRWRIGGIYVI